MDGLVSEHIQEVILGLDWLESQGANWNFCEGKLTIGEETYVLQSATRGVFCRRFVVQESVIIPAQKRDGRPNNGYSRHAERREFRPRQWRVDVRSGRTWKRTSGVPHVDSAPGEGCSASSDESNGHRSAPRQWHSDGRVATGRGSGAANMPRCQQSTGWQAGCINELMDGVGAGVTGAQRAQLRKLLQEFGGILSVSEYDMGQTGITKYRIDTETHPQFGNR